MGERVNIHCKALQSLDWSNHRDGVNDYMVLLVKETVTLHKVLSRYLQDTVLEVKTMNSTLNTYVERRIRSISCRKYSHPSAIV